ncbi:MAG: ice-binding family protein [Mucilaginibacter sp.]|uniref:InlB B-repeat-containing protein n=1 Tax=Mucilaginibacter sp. TaxID=1882438 RepID=UPI0032677C1A
MKKKSTLIIDNSSRPRCLGYSQIFNTLCFIAFALAIFAGCKKDTYKAVEGVCPIVTATDPSDKAVDVVLNKVISATFNTAMDSASISNLTFIIKQGATVITGKVSTTADNKVFTFKPTVALLPFVTYTGTITTGATDVFHTALTDNYVWTFTTIPQVTLSANPVLGGTVAGAGVFAQGSKATVTATPNTGFTFTSWTDAGVVVSTSSSYQFTMAGNRTLVANFTAIPVGNFAVVLSSAPVAGGTTGGAGAFAAGTVVTVTSTPNAGYTFTNWTDNGVIVSVSSSYQFIIASNRTLVANYTVIPASQLAVVLSSNPIAGGSTTGSGSYTSGSSVTVTATANVGYTFANWTENGNVVSTSAAYTFALSASRTLVANFTVITFTLTTSAVNGTVVANPNQTTYNFGSAVQLTASPATGYVFTGWSGDATGTANPLTVTMNANKNITATFAPITFTLTVTALNGAVVKNPNATNYNSGTIVQLTATANPGYTFTGWTVDATGTTNPLSVTMNANKNITANFTLNPAVGPTLANLGGAGNFTILTQAGITDVPTSAITGNIGASPISGASLVIGCPEVNGTIYTIDGAGQTSACAVTNKNLVDIAVADMGTAYTTNYGLTTPAPVNEQSSGVLSGETLTPGIYKWSSNVSITTGITLKGGPNDTWVFQIAGNLTVNNSAIITLTGGAQAKNIVWVVAGATTALGTNVDFSGVILSKNLISLNTGAKVTGRLLSQKAVTLIKNIVVNP